MNEQELKEQLKQEIKQEMKKSSRKKIAIILLIIIILVIAFFVYRNISTQRRKEQYKEKYISQEEFSKYTTEIPITIENWKDYITLEFEKKEEKDSFGEVVKTFEQPYFKLKDNIYGYMILEIDFNKNILKDLYSRNKSGLVVTMRGIKTEIPTYQIKDDCKLAFDDIECSKVKGTLYLLDLPEDIWQVQQEEMQALENGEVTQLKGRKYFNLGTESNYTTCWENTYINNLCDKEFSEYEKSIQ